MGLPLRNLLMALGFGFGAIALPAALAVLEVATTPCPELHDAAYARALLSQARLAWEDQRATAGGSPLSIDVPDPASGD